MDVSTAENGQPEGDVTPTATNEQRSMPAQDSRYGRMYYLGPKDAAIEMALAYQTDPASEATRADGATRADWAEVVFGGLALAGSALGRSTPTGDEVVTTTVSFKNDSSLILIPFELVTERSELDNSHDHPYFREAPGMMFPGDDCAYVFTKKYCHPGQHFAVKFAAISVDPAFPEPLHIELYMAQKLNDGDKVTIQALQVHLPGASLESYVPTPTTGLSCELRYLAFQGRDGTGYPSFGVTALETLAQTSSSQSNSLYVTFTPLFERWTG